MPGPFVIVRDPRGSLVHVRRRDDGDGTSAVAECVGCIEVGLYEIVRSLILAETKETTAGGDRLGEGSRG